MKQTLSLFIFRQKPVINIFQILNSINNTEKQ